MIMFFLEAPLVFLLATPLKLVLSPDVDLALDAIFNMYRNRENDVMKASLGRHLVHFHFIVRKLHGA
jgi:hypothetical protein